MTCKLVLKLSLRLFLFPRSDFPTDIFMGNLELIFAIFLVSTNEWACYTIWVELFLIINWGHRGGDKLGKHISVRYHNSNSSLITITIYIQSYPMFMFNTVASPTYVHNKEGSKFMELTNRSNLFWSSLFAGSFSMR